MKYLPITWVKSIEDVSLWDCASAIRCINISRCLLRYCLTKYFYFLGSEIDLCPWACLYSLIPFRFEVLDSYWLGGAIPSNISSYAGICCFWLCPNNPVQLCLVFWQIWKPAPLTWPFHHYHRIGLCIFTGKTGYIFNNKESINKIVCSFLFSIYIAPASAIILVISLSAGLESLKNVLLSSYEGPCEL